MVEWMHMRAFIVFGANAAVMVIEIVGARTLAPYLGTSVEVWAGLLAMVLLGLAAGYWLGGLAADYRLAQLTPLNADPVRDGRALDQLLSISLIAAGLYTIIAWSIGSGVAHWGAAVGFSAGLTMGASLAALILFVAPSVFLAAISPIAVRAELTALAGSAGIIGRFSAIAAAGSIAGALASGIVLVPLFGTHPILIGTGLCLIALSMLPAASFKKALAAAAIAALVVAGGRYVQAAFGEDPAPLALPMERVADIDTRYNRIWIYDAALPSGRTMRTLHTDPYGVQCASYIDGEEISDELVFGYLKNFDAAFLAVPEPERILVIGACNYSYPRHLARRYPAAQIDVIEIDPGMTAAAHTWFGFNATSSIATIHADARMAINAYGTADSPVTGPYDVIFVDAYNSFSSIPHQLVTQEAFRGLSAMLAPDGVLAVNVVGTLLGRGAQYTASLVRTAESVFPRVGLYQVYDVPQAVPQNLLMFGSQSGAAAARLDEALASPLIHASTSPIALIPISAKTFERTAAILLTDEYAPVESLTRPYRRRTLGY